MASLETGDFDGKVSFYPRIEYQESDDFAMRQAKDMAWTVATAQTFLDLWNRCDPDILPKIDLKMPTVEASEIAGFIRSTSDSNDDALYKYPVDTKPVFFNREPKNYVSRYSEFVKYDDGVIEELSDIFFFEDPQTGAVVEVGDGYMMVFDAMVSPLEFSRIEREKMATLSLQYVDEETISIAYTSHTRQDDGSMSRRTEEYQIAHNAVYLYALTSFAAWPDPMDATTMHEYEHIRMPGHSTQVISRVSKTIHLFTDTKEIDRTEYFDEQGQSRRIETRFRVGEQSSLAYPLFDLAREQLYLIYDDEFFAEGDDRIYMTSTSEDDPYQYFIKTTDDCRILDIFVADNDGQGAA